MIFPRLIRSITNLYMGTKYGKATEYMQTGKVTTIEGIESDCIDEEVVLKRET